MGADASHNGSAPPPFLTKTYEMVDDPSTDAVVSWSENNSSFVVWNVADFTKFLLPQYFKHNNFSSFVRQLNTYGFHKIDHERQEFANEGFAKGNKDALKNIHRRKPSVSHKHSSQKESLTVCNDPGHAELEEEIQKLKEDKEILINELMKVQSLQETTEAELETLAKRLEALEERQQCLIKFLAHALCSPTFMHSVNQYGSLALSKKRRLPEQAILIGMGESWDDEGRCLIPHASGNRGQAVSEGQIAYQSEEGSRCESSFDRVVRQLAGSTLNQLEETSPVSASSKTTFSEMQNTLTEYTTTVDLLGNRAPESPNEAVECSSQVECDGSDLKADCTVYVCNERENEPALDHLQDEDVIDRNKASGSNDLFWESMLTENPCLTQSDSRNCRSEGHSNERWFL